LGPQAVVGEVRRIEFVGRRDLAESRARYDLQGTGKPDGAIAEKIKSEPVMRRERQLDNRRGDGIAVDVSVVKVRVWFRIAVIVLIDLKRLRRRPDTGRNRSSIVEGLVSWTL
jgi:hypothetical protein